MKKFLGRTLNEKTMCWEYEDGSGSFTPDEMRMELELNPTILNLLALKQKYQEPNKGLLINK